MTPTLSDAWFLAAAPSHSAAYDPRPAGADILLEYLAWAVTAAGVFGLLVVGLNMAVQMNRGEPGEGGAHFRGAFIVVIACLIGTTAGPLVSFLGDVSLAPTQQPAEPSLTPTP
ncbi:hypothetical protein [Streptomyces fumanus]|uniref:Uncharacterized protein n=1 Tax=Streptomyces fumanus TaxID=67302 RepID=A0A919A4Q3_9ACTN|nr:hypothetical protein [Streptomyces fumanus]GHE85314.1 hypothetical protein GCM10018772_05670 [Streptomyces fumanus]